MNLSGKGYIAILNVDVQGVEQMKADPDIDARYIFIKPPSLMTLDLRLRERGLEEDDDEKNIQGILVQAQKDLEYIDKPGFCDKVIENDDLETAYDELIDFIRS